MIFIREINKAIIIIIIATFAITSFDALDILQQVYHSTQTIDIWDLHMNIIWIWWVVYEFHLDFTLYLWGCLPENTCKKTKQWSILYQSSSETDLVKLYRNTTFTYYDPVYSNLHPFYKVLPYQNYWNVKYNTKEMISISNLTFFKISFAT